MPFLKHAVSSTFALFRSHGSPWFARLFQFGTRALKTPAESGVLQKSGLPSFTGAPAASAFAKKAKVELRWDHEASDPTTGLGLHDRIENAPQTRP